MEYISSDSEFAKAMAPLNPAQFATDYNNIIDKLKPIEKEYLNRNPNFVMDEMFDCVPYRGGVVYGVSENCKDKVLRGRIKRVLESV